MLNKKRVSSPMRAIQEAIEVMAEAGYEDTDVTEDELEMAHNRFENAIGYLSVRSVSERLATLNTMLDSLDIQLIELRQKISDLEVKINEKI